MSYIIAKQVPELSSNLTSLNNNRRQNSSQKISEYVYKILRREETAKSLIKKNRRLRKVLEKLDSFLKFLLNSVKEIEMKINKISMRIEFLKRLSKMERNKDARIEKLKRLYRLKHAQNLKSYKLMMESRLKTSTKTVITPVSKIDNTIVTNTDKRKVPPLRMMISHSNGSNVIGMSNQTLEINLPQGFQGVKIKKLIVSRKYSNHSRMIK
ncbi:unnamed protein product [Gordionus sp. m RMFG-2023]